MLTVTINILLEVSKCICWSCNSSLAASFRSYAQKKDFYKPKMEENSTLNSKAKTNNGLQPLLPMDENSTSSPTSSKSFSDSQLEMFNYRHGIAILHLLATLMFVPSLVAWLQVCSFFNISNLVASLFVAVCRKFRIQLKSPDFFLITI